MLFFKHKSEPIMHAHYNDTEHFMHIPIHLLCHALVVAIEQRDFELQDTSSLEFFAKIIRIQIT